VRSPSRNKLVLGQDFSDFPVPTIRFGFVNKIQVVLVASHLVDTMGRGDVSAIQHMASLASHSIGNEPFRKDVPLRHPGCPQGRKSSILFDMMRPWLIELDRWPRVFAQSSTSNFIDISDGDSA